VGLVKRAIRKSAQNFVARYGWELHRIRGSYTSETSKCRSRLEFYCQGYGIDLGPGGDPITPSAIRVDLPEPYSTAGALPVQLGGDARNLRWFTDHSLDYVYSSHLLEDFSDIEPVLFEWIRVLKPGANLVLYCPDQVIYEEHCRATGQQPNLEHKDPHFNIDTVKRALDKIGRTRNIHEKPLVDIYSWELVAQKIES
jgi:predicted SAM-dependent methyltransferase